LGHLTFVWCIGRNFLAIGKASYSFVQHKYLQRRALWPSVLRELRWARDTLFLIQVPLRITYARDVQATDASPWGCGLVGKAMPESFVKSHASHSERWRYKWCSHVHPRTRALELLDMPLEETTSVVSSELMGWEKRQSVPDFSRAELGSGWQVRIATPYKNKEGITVLEGRSIILGLRRIARCKKNFNQHHLFLNDNFGAILALDRGRAWHFPLLRSCRRFGVLCAVTGIRAHVRWVISELNPADAASRRYAPKPVRGQSFKKTLSGGSARRVKSRVEVGDGNPSGDSDTCSEESSNQLSANTVRQLCPDDRRCSASSRHERKSSTLSGGREEGQDDLCEVVVARKARRKRACNADEFLEVESVGASAQADYTVRL